MAPRASHVAKDIFNATPESPLWISVSPLYYIYMTFEYNIYIYIGDFFIYVYRYIYIHTQKFIYIYAYIFQKHMPHDTKIVLSLRANLQEFGRGIRVT